MPRVRLVHWKEGDAPARVALLERAGYAVDFDPADGAGVLRRLRADPPDLVVIDLDRLPSHGREIGRAIRTTKALRHLPLVFAGGEASKVAAIEQLLPDAVYGPWGSIKTAMKRALATAPVDPVVPVEHMAGYSGTPLPRKLGIAPGTMVALVDAPKGFDLGRLPDGARVVRGARGSPDVALFFVRERARLEARIERMDALAGERRLWICWPKKASGVDSDLSEGIVRETGLARGLVDYKIAAIDGTWSGLLFTRRKS